MTDSQSLLAEYARTNSEAAFRGLVDCYVDLVYSTALRLVEGDRHRAEDVAQIVFVDLSRTARTLSREVMLGGWLHRHTCFVAGNTMRAERRRRSRERQAVEINELQDNSGTDFSSIAPVLDEALNELEEPDRTAILLRFFEQHDFSSVGEALGSNEDAARMRVTRALDKLQDLLKRRGVTTTAAALPLVLSASVIQAAPAGLALTISTAAASAVTTIHTTTVAIAMTTLQKSLIAATLVAAVATGIYEAQKASALRLEVQTLQEQQAGRIQQAQQERDEAISKLTAMQAQTGQVNAGAAEILRLRAEVARLRSEAQVAAKPGASNPTESAAMTLVYRVAQLKQRLEQVPEARIPEMQLLDEEDWLAVVKGRPLETDIDYRRALSALRSAGEGKLVTAMQKALRGFAQSNNGQFPTDVAQLQSYFDSPMDAAILDRWMVAPGKTVPSVGVGEIIITQKGPAIDEVFDSRRVLGSGGGSGSADFLSPETVENLKPVYDAYRAAHNGKWQTDFTELQPYARTPEQHAALQRMILRHSASN